MTTIGENKITNYLTGDKPVRERTTSGPRRSPGGKTMVKGGGSSAERLRKGDHDAYEDRIDEMHHNIGKYYFVFLNSFPS